MDLATRESEHYSYSLLTKLLTYLPNVWLFYHLTTMMFANVDSHIIIEEFKHLRDLFYYLYMFVALLVTVYFKLLKSKEETFSNEDVVRTLRPRLVVAIIITTFSYAFADTIAGLCGH